MPNGSLRPLASFSCNCFVNCSKL
jgi:hypothetical protein